MSDNITLGLISDNITSASISGAVGLAAAFLGASLTARFNIQQQQKQTRIQVALDLYAEFQSESMLESRIVACNMFEANLNNLPLGFKNLRERIGSDEWFHVSKVIHFFERYAVYYNEGFLDKDLSKSTLNRYFICWYSKHLKQLAESKEKDSDEWGAWAKPIKQLGDELKV
jgi:hypothetical protein